MGFSIGFSPFLATSDKNMNNNIVSVLFDYESSFCGAHCIT